MILTILQDSTGTALTTLTALKARLGITTTDTDDQLQSAIDEASSAVETYVGYPLSRKLYQEDVGAYGNQQLMLSRTPVRAIDSITTNGQAVDPTSYQVQLGKGLIYRELGWPWSAGVEWDLEGHVVPKSERQAFRVIYEAGFLLGDSVAGGFLLNGSRTLPNDIEHATLECAKMFFLSRKRDPGIENKRIGDLSITYRYRGLTGATPELLPSDSLGALQRYRRMK